MPLSDSELRAIRLLFREEMKAELGPFKEEVRERFTQVDEAIDGLYKLNETRVQEYLSIKRQVERLEEQGGLTT